MNYKNQQTDSGSYVNGVYTTKNGFSGSGLNCPRGTRLYNTELIQPIFFVPEDIGETEEFKRITSEVAPDIMPYYAISNYGRVLNTYSGKIIKPNYRPNGYEYYCLSANNSKYGQKKYTTHRMVMNTFVPIENSDQLQVNHINGKKSDNYINKTMPDGNIESNLEWVTPSENIYHKYSNNLGGNKIITDEDARKIREMHANGYSFEQIQKVYSNTSTSNIQSICSNLTHYDSNYVPVKGINTKLNPANVHKLVDSDVDKIKKLHADGYSYTDIQKKFYSEFSISAISDVCRGKSHNN